MFTTLAETYMIASRMDAHFAHRVAESERLRLLRIRRAERKAWIAEQAREAPAARRRALLRALRGGTGRGLERMGAAIARLGHVLAAGPARPQGC